MNKNEWYTVSKGKAGRTSYMKIHGGWLIRELRYNSNGGETIGLVFIPDPKHKMGWNRIPT